MVRCGCFGPWGGRAGGSSSGTPQAHPPPAAPSQQQAAAPATAAAAGPPKLARTELPLRRPEALLQGGGGGAAPPPLRVMTFNILADGLAQHGEFVHVSDAPHPCKMALTGIQRLPAGARAGRANPALPVMRQPGAARDARRHRAPRPRPRLVHRPQAAPEILTWGYRFPRIIQVRAPAPWEGKPGGGGTWSGPLVWGGGLAQK
jgi:hypothetical protein